MGHVNVDIVTAFDPSTGHRSRYVLSSAGESAIEQSITLQDGTGAASEICLRLIEGGRAETFHAAIRRSIEELGAPQRLGSIEIDDSSVKVVKPMSQNRDMGHPKCCLA
jgi:hypothetical protein